MTIPAELQELITSKGSAEAALVDLWKQRGAATEITNWTLEESRRQGLRSLIDDAGSIEAAIQQLYQDNYQTRQGKRAAQAQAEQLEQRVAELGTQVAALNTPGSVVLAADEAAQWQAVKDLGTPAEIQAKLEAGEAAGTELDTLKRREHLRTVADVAGYDPTVFMDRDLAAGGLAYRIEERQDAEGQNVKVAVVDLGGEAGSKDLAVYASEHWQPYLPVLETVAGENGRSAQGAGSTTTHLRQHPGSGQGGDDLVKTFLQEREQVEQARPNPLAPATTTS